MGLVAFPAHGRVYADSNVFIHSLEDVEPYAADLAPIWDGVRERRYQLCTSALSLLECLVVPYRDRNAEAVWQYRQAFAGYRVLMRRPVDDEVLDLAARLRAESTGLRTPDAIHVATYMLEGCEVFLTNDQRMARLPDVRVTTLDDLVKPEAG